MIRGLLFINIYLYLIEFFCEDSQKILLFRLLSIYPCRIEFIYVVDGLPGS